MARLKESIRIKEWKVKDLSGVEYNEMSAAMSKITLSESNSKGLNIKAHDGEECDSIFCDKIPFSFLKDLCLKWLKEQYGENMVHSKIFKGTFASMKAYIRRMRAKHSAEVNKKTRKLKKVKYLFCDKCGKSFREQKDLFDHERIHRSGHGLVKNVMVCKTCEKLCAGFHRYRMHRKIGCVNDKDKNCKKNYFSGNSQTIFKCKSSSEHSAASSFKCGICDSVFLTKKELHKHYRTHENQYACAYCGKVGFIVAKDAFMHVLNDHILDLRRSSDKVSAKKSKCKQKMKIYTCKKCDAEFKERRLLDRHDAKKHSYRPKTRSRSKSELKEESLFIKRLSKCSLKDSSSV